MRIWQFVFAVSLLTITDLSHASGSKKVCIYLIHAPAAGAILGGAIGGVAGSGIGMVTAGVGITATYPLMIGGAAVGGWTGKAVEQIVSKVAECK